MDPDYICPLPLVYAYDDSYTTLYVYEPGNCAVPCPSITYTSDEREYFTTILKSLSLITLTVSILGFLSLIREFRKNFIRIMFLLGFIVLSVILVIFLSHYEAIVCNTASHYVKRGSFCVIQACLVIFFLNWTQVWSCILAIDTFFHVYSVYSPDKIPDLHKRYLQFAIVFCSITAIIPLSANNLGFDPYANIPICLFLVSDNPYYFWTTLYAPFLFLSATCLIVTSINMHKIYNILLGITLVSRPTDMGEMSRETSVSSRYSDTVVSPHKVIMPSQNYSESSRESSIGLVSLPSAGMLGDNPVAYTSTDIQVKMGSGEFRDVGTSAEYMLSMDRMSTPLVTSVISSSYPSSGNIQIVSPSSNQTDNGRFGLIMNTVVYGGRSLAFLIFFCGSTGLIGYLLLYYYDKKYDYYVDGSETYAGCVAATSYVLNPESQEEANQIAESYCGSHPSIRPDAIEVNLHHTNYT